MWVPFPDVIICARYRPNSFFWGEGGRTRKNWLLPLTWRVTFITTRALPSSAVIPKNGPNFCFPLRVKKPEGFQLTGGFRLQLYVRKGIIRPWRTNRTDCALSYYFWPSRNSGFLPLFYSGEWKVQTLVRSLCRIVFFLVSLSLSARMLSFRRVASWCFLRIWTSCYNNNSSSSSSSSS